VVSCSSQIHHAIYAGVVVLMLVTYIPALSLWLPGVFK
jgi:TRAP-type C4-dicarboxylate transport system permease large subunit